MASIKVKFRPSTIERKEGTIYYQVSHNRIVRQIRTNYGIFMQEWNGNLSQIDTSNTLNSERLNYLVSVIEHIRQDIKRLEFIIRQQENKSPTYTTDKIVSIFQKQRSEHFFFRFMQGIIDLLICMSKHRTAETYTAALRSFSSFRNNEDILLNEVDSDLMQLYEAYLHNKTLTRNTISFYMRILRAVYNRAIEKGLTEQHYPFKHVYTGIDKTVKRAVPLKFIKRIKNLDLSLKPNLDFARNMFLFSFYTRGMSFIDMAYLKKTDLKNNILSYKRRKTGQQLFIRWESCMQEVVDKYKLESFSPYLLPILRYPNEDNRRQYRNALLRINKALKGIAKLADIAMPLTLYCARHSWASAAKNKNIPLSVISEGMGHKSETTTQIYLASLDYSIVDKANAQILKEL